ncbi:MAG: tRNA (adenosine(37)-N6)-threonylcarbamoyltransferase complex ATPase subunit type 1 TsaE [Vicinamibacterales bacterium]
MTVTSHSEADTRAAARALASTLHPGDIIVLHGNLGAGKTAFVKGLAEGLGVDPAEVSSPTFTLIQEYRGGRLTLHHIDLYRLAPPDVDDLGLDELVSGGGVVAIEWPDRWRDAPAGVIRVTIESVGDDERSITVEHTREWST